MLKSISKILVGISEQTLLDILKSNLTTFNNQNLKDGDALISKSGYFYLFKREPEIDSKDNNDILMEILINKCPNLPTNNNFIQIKGYTQSSKTLNIIYLSLLSILKGESTLIILRDSNEDKYQIQERIKDELEKINFELEGKGIFKPFIFPINSGKISGDKIKNILSGEKTGIIICIANQSPLKKITNNLEPSINYNFQMIIDEIDDSLLSDTSQRANYISQLREVSNRTIGVSATVLDITMKEATLSKNIFVLDPPKDYKRIDSFKLEELGNNDDEIEVNIFLEKYKNVKTFRVSSNHHPFIALINPSIEIRNHDKIAEKVRDIYPLNYTVITNNGKGLMLYHHNLQNQIAIKGTKIYSNYNRTSKYHIFPKDKIGVSDIIQFLKDNGGVEKFPRILIIAGKMAGRGISYVSRDYGKCLDEDKLGWHLTNVYYTPSKATTAPNMIQAIGRGCIRSNDNINITLHMRRKDYNLAMDGFMKQDEIIEIVKMKQTDYTEEKTINELSLGIKLNTNRFLSEKSKRKKLVNKPQYLPKFIETNDRDDIEKYGLGEEIDCENISKIIKAVDVTKLTENEMDYYNFTISEMRKHGYNVWVKKAENIRYKGNECIQRIWKKSISVKDENSLNGLLICKEGKGDFFWYKLNEKN